MLGCFLQRDAMHSADYAVAKCLSVCPSVCHTPVFCRNGSTCHQTFSPSGSHTIFSTRYQTLWQYLTGTPPPPPNGAVECRGLWKKIAIFDQYLGLSQKRYEIHCYSGVLIRTYTHTLLRVSFRMTSSDLEWLTEIFNDTKRRAVLVSLRQLSYLLVLLLACYLLFTRVQMFKAVRTKYSGLYGHRRFV